MLVLKRREGEKIVVLVDGERLEINVVRLGGNGVKLGFTGPQHMRIYREEVFDTVSAPAAA